MIKGPMQQKDVTFVNIYVPNRREPKYIKQILTELKGEVDSNTVRVGVFNTPFTSMDRSSRQKINKGTLALKDTLDQRDLLDIPSKSRRIHIFLKCTWNVLQNILHVRPQNKSH